MTGHGEAQRSRDGVSVAVEVRTVNNRFFKLHLRASEGYASLESPIEDLLRQRIRRGTVQVSLRIDRESSADDYSLNEAILASYARQLSAVIASAETPRNHKAPVAAQSIAWESLLALPGVVVEKRRESNLAEVTWPLVQEALNSAVQHLDEMRRKEGSAMASDLTLNCQQIAAAVTVIEGRAPLVVEAYRLRLTDKLNTLLKEYGIQIQPADIVREVGLFADRSDISEETVRLRSHLEQFLATIQASESNGRKLDFLTQELFRETNTIGSKSNDAEISRHVIEMKTIIERIREMVQNVE